MCIYYAIRRKTDGKLLPTVPPHQRGGQTHVSFEGNLQNRPPRLFPTAKGANVAMKLWLRGDWWKDRNEPYVPGQKRKIAFQNPRLNLIGKLEVIPVRVTPQDHLNPPVHQPVIDNDDFD